MAVKEKQIAIRLDVSMEQRLKSLSDHADRTMAQVVRLAIQDYLDAHPLPSAEESDVQIAQTPPAQPASVEI